MDVVTIGDEGNASDSTSYGSVGYTYAMGKYEVTINQYTAFLNAVAATDTYSLYNENMATRLTIAGVSRQGSAGSYSYSVVGDGNRPILYVSWFDAARFSNWLQNGQPVGPQTVGTTEGGAYSLNGAVSGIIAKNASAEVWIPNENEWYKAAYFDPSSDEADGNGTLDYWLYPTRSDITPGNEIGTGSNQANYNSGIYSVTQSSSFSSSQNYLTPAGAFSLSGSYYGTFDQGGNAWEWIDAVSGSSRVQRGSGWNYNESYLRSSARITNSPTRENADAGFRIAMVPEPAMTASLISGMIVLLSKRRRSR